jgi:ATP-dependent protease Clp ATPase subunit
MEIKQIPEFIGKLKNVLKLLEKLKKQHIPILLGKPRK